MRYAASWLLAGALGLCGCIEDPTPKHARIVVDGAAGTPVRVIVASEFVASVNEQGQTRVVIFAADTVTTMLPYEKTINIEAAHQIFAETARADADVENVRMQVFIDGNIRFNEGGLLGDRPFRFVYTFNRPTTADIEVVL